MSQKLLEIPAQNASLMALLQQEPIQTLNLIGILENTEPKDLKIFVDDADAPTGVLLVKGYFHYIYTQSTTFLDLLLLDYFKEDFYGFSGLSSFVAHYLLPHFTLQWDSPCYLYYLPEGQLQIQLKTRPVLSIPLQYAEEIDSFYTYKDNYSIYKIRESLEKLPSSGYFEGDTLCSWVLVHDDNSLGIMYTKEAYRGRGLAVDVSIDLCEKEIQRGKSPFLQINIHNTMSPGLAEKCGFVRYPEPAENQKPAIEAYWFGGYRGLPPIFKTVGNALGVAVDTLLPLYGLPEEDPQLKCQPIGEPLELPSIEPNPEAKVTLERFFISKDDQNLGTIELHVLDGYWFYVSDMAVSVGKADCLIALAHYLKGLERDCLLFSGCTLPISYKTFSI